ncbi:hypothetical protein ACGFII_28915 [Micromonospora chalcea]
MSWSAQRIATYHADRLNYLALHPMGAAVLIADALGWRLLADDGTPLWSRTDPAHRLAPAGMLWTPAGDTLFAIIDGRVTAVRADSGVDLVLGNQTAGITDATTLTIDSTGSDLAVGTGSGSVHILHLRSGRSERLAAIDPVAALAWSGPNHLLVATTDTLQQWDTERRTMVRTSAINLDGVAALARSPVDGRTALIDRRGVRLLGSHGPSGDLIGEVSSAFALEFTRDESRLLVGTPVGVHVLDTALVRQSVLPGAILGGGHVSRAQCGLIAVRQDDETVALYSSSDSVHRLDRETSAFAIQRWAAAMAASVGRARSVAYDERPLTAQAEPIVGAGEGSGSPGFVWTSDGWIVESPAGRLVRTQAEAAQAEWAVYLDWPVLELAADPRLRHVAVAARNDSGRVGVLDADSGAERSVVPGGQSPVLAPDERDLLAVPEPGPAPEAVLVYDLGNPTPIARLPVDEGLGRLAWSADGRLLAGAADGKVIVWDAVRWQRRQIIAMPQIGALVTRVAWSPDGEFLAAQPSAGRGKTQVYLAAGDHYRQLGPVGGADWAPALAWSPDSKLLAAASADQPGGEVEVWAVSDGRLKCRVPAPSADAGSVWSISWSPEGRSFAVTYTGGRVVRYRLSRPSAADSAALRHPAPLLARLGTYGTLSRGVPLSTLAQLYDLLGEDAATAGLKAVADLPGVRALRALRWQADARIGLVAMLAADLDGETRYRAPSGTIHDDLSRQLLDVLLGVTVEVADTNPPIGALARVLGEVDDGTLTLLRLLGPQAVAEDPMLPARIRALRADLAPLSSRDLRLLSVRLNVTDHGRAEGGGTGEERAGLARHGRFNRLLPTQLALDHDVFELQYAEGNLLYRTRVGRLPPKPRSAVILLDDTAGAHGRVGITIRTCAHLLAEALIEHHRRCVLVPLGDPSGHTVLDEPADLLRIWTAGSTVPPRPAEAAQVAGSLLPGLTDGLGTLPLVVLLTHPYQPVPRVADLQTVAVAYPQGPTRHTARRPNWHLLPTVPSAASLRAVLTRVLNGS